MLFTTHFSPPCTPSWGSRAGFLWELAQCWSWDAVGDWCPRGSHSTSWGVLHGSALQVSLDFVRSGSYELERMGVPYPAQAHTRSPFDPDNQRVKGIY